ncbi:hypothetical protein GCM10022226_53650 [Sphaerisporangium flaviroseum]|uniref:Uncharacterized protein n=1 Tax=Sphaerisporangium flaviroseum TaxID=509199 RepID=A0ABP7ISQ7_9ACTN
MDDEATARLIIAIRTIVTNGVPSNETEGDISRTDGARGSASTNKGRRPARSSQPPTVFYEPPTNQNRPERGALSS